MVVLCTCVWGEGAFDSMVPLCKCFNVELTGVVLCATREGRRVAQDPNSNSSPESFIVCFMLLFTLMACLQRVNSLVRII